MKKHIQLEPVYTENYTLSNRELLHEHSKVINDHMQASFIYLFIFGLTVYIALYDYKIDKKKKYGSSEDADDYTQETDEDKKKKRRNLGVKYLKAFAYLLLAAIYANDTIPMIIVGIVFLVLFAGSLYVFF